MSSIVPHGAPSGSILTRPAEPAMPTMSSAVSGNVPVHHDNARLGR
jgi:hypothetical protein